MPNMGHYDTQIKISVKNGGTFRDLKITETLLIESGYQVQSLKKLLDFDALTHLLKEFLLSNAGISEVGF